MSSEAQDARAIAGEAVPGLPDGFSKQQIGAALSTLISASIGDICVVMSKAPSHKFHTLADIEWMVLPAVLTGQYYVGEYAHAEQGARAPAAVVTWASVTDEVASRLMHGSDSVVRLQPAEWRGGDQLWLIDTIGNPQVLGLALKTLAETQFKGKTVNVATRLANGQVKLETLHGLLAGIGANVQTEVDRALRANR